MIKYLNALFLALALLAGNGCTSTPNRIAYNSVATVASGVNTAAQAYWDFKAQFPGKITEAQDAQVKAAYLKYQASMQVLADACLMFGFGGNTNAPVTFTTMEQTALASGQDVISLINTLKGK